MYAVKKVKIVKNVSHNDILNAKETAVVEFLNEKRYLLFSDSYKRVMAEYLKDHEMSNDNVDIVIRIISNDEHAKYERYFEIAVTIFTTSEVENNKVNNQLDFTFEIFKMNEDGAEEQCDLMSYYMAEYKDEAK